MTLGKDVSALFPDVVKNMVGRRVREEAVGEGLEPC